MRDSIAGDGSLFQPDTLLPSQFFAIVRKKVPQEAEYRLAAAVLQDAIECFQKHLHAHQPKARALFTDAETWIGSDDRSWPYSFVNICELLGLNADYVRSGLAAWKANQLARRKRPVLRVHAAPLGCRDQQAARAS